MNTQENTRSVIPNSPAVDTALNLGRKALALALAWLMVPLGVGDLYAQTAPPPPPDQGQYNQAPPPPDQGQYQNQSGSYDQGPPPQAYNPLSPDQLGQLVAPIALYPDALVAQILAASTYPTEVADAENFLRANQGLPPEQLGGMANQMNWDPSVKALIAFPSVLYNLDRNLDWTSQLGNAYYNQPQDVMSAIQDMRARAYAAGNLRSSSELAVQYQPGNIIIAPVNPDIVYVPWYNPWVVYGAPVVAWGGYYPPPRPVGYYVAVGVAIGFGFGIAIASWNNWGWGYNHWGMGWHNRAVVYQRNIYVSRSEHVVNHGYYGHYDRDAAARNYNRNLERRAPNVHPNYGANNRYRPNNNVRPAQNYNQPNNSYRPNNNTRPAQNTKLPPQQNRNQNLNRPQNSPNTYNRPENNVRQNRNTNLPPQQQPQQYKQPQQQNRQQNVYRPPQQNRQQNYNRPQQQNRQQNVYRPPQQNQQQNVYRPPQQNQQQNYSRPPQQNRPVQQPRPQQSQPQARPQPRPQQQPHPQQSRPENRGQSQKKDNGHRR
jgi:Protein of unknown function (DUF3300)